MFKHQSLCRQDVVTETVRLQGYMKGPNNLKGLMVSTVSLLGGKMCTAELTGEGACNYQTIFFLLRKVDFTLHFNDIYSITPLPPEGGLMVTTTRPLVEKV